MSSIIIKGINKREKEPIENFINNSFNNIPLSEVSKMTINKFASRVNNIEDLDELDKIVLASNYIQSSVQYYSGRITEANHKKYEVELDLDSEEHANPNTVFEKNIGNCNAISGAFVLLARSIGVNELDKVDVGDHSYCIKKYKDKIFCIDPTWSCSRNENQVDGAPKATSFSDKYVMVALNDFTEHHIVDRMLTTDDNLASEKLNREMIQNSVQKLKSKGVNFDYSNVPVLKSKEIVQDLSHEDR